MNAFMKLTVTMVSALVATALTVGFAAAASAVPADRTEPIAAATSEPPQVTYIKACLPPGDTIELRTGIGAAIGAAIGALVGLPVFLVGAIPGAIIVGLIGAAVGASSYAIDSGRLEQQGLC
ncbi:hypothetical protein [Nocardia beijingensis]|uniref:hypothetical protein n=1 Tax=Nocardia beijingensis TaxID=95162 RepID=UPI001895C218|nr:hypothetical protein [Nocardia beijingensis]MBF6077967.1 hypothetical protein [Nocardia beijingensis]